MDSTDEKAPHVNAPALPVLTPEETTRAIVAIVGAIAGLHVMATAKRSETNELIEATMQERLRAGMKWTLQHLDEKHPLRATLGRLFPEG